jgi:hypothetical protein
MPTETGSMQKNNQRGRLLCIIILLWCIYPEVIVALDDSFLCRQQVILGVRGERSEKGGE